MRTMSNAYKCDRCEAYQDDMAAVWTGRNSVAYDNGNPGDFALCNDCADEFGKFMGGRELKYSVLDAMSSVNLNYEPNEVTPQTHGAHFGDQEWSVSFTFGEEKYPETDLKRQIELGGRNY